jgi:hypothetical protein
MSEKIQFRKTPVHRGWSLSRLAEILTQGADLLLAGGKAYEQGDDRKGRNSGTDSHSTLSQNQGNERFADDLPYAHNPPYVSPKIRAYGKARLDIASRVESQQDWDELWKAPLHPFPFRWGKSWKQSFEYRVADFPAEVGFFTDLLGFPVKAIGPDYAMFTSPDESFHFSVSPSLPDGQSTPPEGVSMQFMVSNIIETTDELESRGVVFERAPSPVESGSSLYSGYFRTPNGICIDLWGEVERPTPQSGRPSQTRFSEGRFEERSNPQPE